MIIPKDEKINLIKRINKETGHGLIDCKKALEQSNWNIEKAKEILAMCKKHFMTSYDESGSIGKRYRRADAIGTPWQISVDEKTVEENIVTLRDRDTMEQIELKVEELVPYIEERIQFEK